MRLLGSLLAIRNDRLRFVLHSHREYGDVAAFRMGPKALYLFSHPDHFRHVLAERPENYRKGVGLADAAPLLGRGLLTSEGELWASQRKLLQRVFRHERVEELAGVMAEAAKATAERWRHLSLDAPLDAGREMVRLTLGILCSTILPADLPDNGERMVADLDLLSHWAIRRMSALLKTPLGLPTPANLLAQGALRRLDRLAREILCAARARGVDGDDLLSMLVACEREGDADEETLRDEVLTLFLAGHETTAALLTWAWLLLGCHPESEERLHAELDHVLGGRLPTLVDLPRLPFTQAILEETLRLYPPVWMLPRRAIAEDEVGGYHVPAGADALLCVYTLHRHPELWPAPDAFRPERFLNGSSRPPYTFLPFGAGPRSCLGSRFGMMEAVMVLATLAQSFRLEPLDDTVEAEALLSLRPRLGLPFRLHARQG